MSATASFRCRACGADLERSYPDPGGVFADCEECDAEQPYHPDALDENGRLARCPVCSLKVLYRQRDFNQALGCTIVAVAAVLAPFTWYLSLVAAALLDLVLYLLTPEVAICYRWECRAHLRGFRPGPWVRPFDLMTYDYYKSQAGRLPTAYGTAPEEVQTGGPPIDPASLG